ncbi:DUF2398 family protein, partial [Nocardia cyriacigeorgica]
ERRAEGVALIDTSGRLSDVRFPGTGTLAQVGLLLAGEIADRVLDIDDPIARHTGDTEPESSLAADLDAAIPRESVFEPLSEFDTTPAESDEPPTEPAREPDYPFVETAWIDETVRALTDRYGATFAAQWQADVPGLTAEVIALLERLRLIVRAPGGVLALPALARYRGAVVTVRAKKSAELFVTAAETFPSDAEDRPHPEPVLDTAGTEGAE